MSDPLPEVLSASALSNSFLGNLVEVCIVTRDHRRAMEGLVRLGVGPWRVYTFDESTVAARTYRAEPADFTVKVCFADVGGIAFEIMQPLHGPSIFQEHLDAHGEGIHHVAFDCGGQPFEQRVEEFVGRGFPFVQGGRFAGRNAFAFFGTEEATSACFETYDMPADFEWPEPEYWYPAPPPPG